MPYGGSSKSEDKKIERCVIDLMGDSKFKPRKGRDKKSSAIAICKSSIMGGKMDIETFTYEPEEKEQYTKGTAVNNVHIFKAGKYRGKPWTKEMVEKMVENFKKLKELAGFEPPVRIGHRTDNPVENARNVIGYIEDVRSDGKGNAYADLDIHDEKDIENFKKLKRSIEFGPYETNDGKIFDNAFWGLGLVDIPQVEKLTEVNVYSKPLKEEEKMDKEEEKKEIESTDEKEEDKELDKKVEDTTDDSKDDSTEGEDNATDKGGEEEPKEDESSEKSDEVTEMSKQQNKIQSLEKKVEDYEKKIADFAKKEREDKIQSLAKEAKIVTSSVDKEKDFALSLSQEQFDKYIELKQLQPALVELDKELGEQKSDEPNTDDQTPIGEQKKAEEIAEKVTEKYRKEAEGIVVK